MKDILISPPFGNYISHKKCTSICGTFTYHERGSYLSKIYRILKTVRPIRGGWVNCIGLQNPGIHSIKKFDPKKVYSIAAIEQEEWDKMFNFIPKTAQLEINMSCPNMGNNVDMTDDQVIKYMSKYSLIIFKLSPVESVFREIDKLYELGVTHFHIFNTIPTTKGGESGDRLKKYSLETIPKICNKYPQIKIVGGGGIYSKEDIELYKKAGADYFSIASIFFSPIKAYSLLRKI